MEVDRDVPWARFTDRLIALLTERREAYPGRPSTLFLGGGTPSRMPVDQLARLVRAVDALPGAEVSLETNPEDVEPDWLAGVVDAGVTRVSLGVQTFDPRFARLLNRAGTEVHARRAVELVAAAPLASWSVDVIFALPDQSVDDLTVDLQAILASGPPHVSLYGLTWEPGTPFERARARGTLAESDPETWRAMYDGLVDALEASGRHRYEVSNFALPGHASRHNLLYWTDRPYLGVGPSAHGYAPDGARWIDTPDVTAWLDGEAVGSREDPEDEARAIDLLLSALRGVDGLSLPHLADRTRHRVDPAVIRRLVRGGVLAEDGARIALTRAGFPVADAVVGALVEGLEPSPTLDRAPARPLD